LCCSLPKSNIEELYCVSAYAAKQYNCSALAALIYIIETCCNCAALYLKVMQKSCTAYQHYPAVELPWTCLIFHGFQAFPYKFHEKARKHGHSPGNLDKNRVDFHGRCTWTTQTSWKMSGKLLESWT
jgi:hypothetical protein